jgi:hypothetical protein
VAFNSCARYIFGMLRRQNISEHGNKLLGHLHSYRTCNTMYKLIKCVNPGYLRGGLQFGRSRRMLNLITPINRSIIFCSFFVQGAILWNGLGSSHLVGKELEIETDYKPLETMCKKDIDKPPARLQKSCI